MEQMLKSHNTKDMLYFYISMILSLTVSYNGVITNFICKEHIYNYMIYNEQEILTTNISMCSFDNIIK